MVTTLSGVGNIAKFRHFANVAKIASRFSKYQKASKFASTISKIRLAAGAIEISSGSLNILLKLTELRETPFGQALTEYLFYLELLSLSGELTAAIKNGLRKSAKKLVKHEDEIRKATEKEGIEDVDGVMNDLKKVAEDVGSTKFITKGKHLDDFGKLKQVSKYEGEIRKLDYEDAKFFDDEGKVLSESFSQKSKNSVSFSDEDLDAIIKKARNNPKKVILSHNHPTSTGISAYDIKIVFDKQFGGIRAIARDGSNYFVKKIGSMERLDFYKTTNSVVKKIEIENPNIIKKAKLDKNSIESKQLAQMLVDGLVEELVKLKEIEYIKYQ